MTLLQIPTFRYFRFFLRFSVFFGFLNTDFGFGFFKYRGFGYRPSSPLHMMLARESQAVRHFLLSQHWLASNSETKVSACESGSEPTSPTAQSLSKKLKMLEAMEPHQPSSSRTDDNYQAIV
jgi:hypothetical protein